MRKKSRFSSGPDGRISKSRGSQNSTAAPFGPVRRNAAKANSPDEKPARPSRDEFSKLRSGPPAGVKAKIDIPRGSRVVIGTHAILEALATSPKACSVVWFRDGWESSQDLKKISLELKKHNLIAVEKPESALDRFSGSHQGAALFMNSKPEIDWDQIASAEESTVLVLDGIEDPHNLGAVIRTSWLMGVRGILIPEERAVGLTATVHKVACGGVEHVPVETCVNFSNPIEDLKKQGYWVFGLSHEGKKTIFDLKIPEKVVWCIGAEDKGLRSTTERLCDELVRIPQVSEAASYNASVATAIALTETLRQRSVANEKKSSNL